VCQPGTAPNCDDANVCTTDSCVPATGCVHANNTVACDDALFCNGHEVCGGGVCQPGTAVNCDDGIACTGDSCNESTDTCDHTACGVTVAATGSRWLSVTPPSGLTSVALRVSAPGLACLPKYVDAAGALTDSPVFQSSAAWGAMPVGDRRIVPSTTYTVQAEVVPGTPIATGSATTWAWGNADNTDDVNVFDIVCTLDGFQGIFTHCTLHGTDQNSGAVTHPATIDLDDILAVLDAFSGSSYPDVDPCSAGFAASGSASKTESFRAVKDPRIWLVPSTRTVAPGEAVRFDVYAQGMVDIRGYQVALAVKGGATGVLAPDVVRIDAGRDDYLFSGKAVSAATDTAGSRLAGAVRAGGTTTTKPVFLGSFDFRASPDASGTFQVGFRTTETLFRDSGNAARRVDATAVISIGVGGATPTDSGPGTVQIAPTDAPEVEQQ
jgi:hypothetical protein